MNLSVVGYGHTVCGPDWGFSTDGEAFHRMYYVLGGTCRCTIGSQTVHLQPQVLYLLPRHTAYRMAHDPRDPFVVLWQHIRLSDRDTGRRMIQTTVAPGGAAWHVLQAMQAISQDTLVEALPQRDDATACRLESLCLALFALLEHEQSLFLSLDQRLSEIFRLVTDQPQAHLTVAQMAQHAKLERSHFSRLWRAQFHISAQAFLIRNRLEQSARTLLEGGSVSDGAVAAGYADVKAFSRAFSAQFGVSPSKYRKHHISQP